MKRNFIQCAGLIGLAAFQLAAAQKTFADTSSPVCPCPALSNSPATVVITTPWFNNPDPNSTDRYFDIVVDSAPPIVPAGDYVGWCIDVADDIDGGPAILSAFLFSSCDPGLTNGIGPGYPSSVYVGTDVWQKINYILNHKNGAFYWNVQLAIWNLIGGPIDPAFLLPPYPPTTQSQVDGLLADAEANAANWQPQCGDVTAVVIQVPHADTKIQLVILELPCCSVHFTKCPPDIDFGCNPPAHLPGCDTSLAAAISCCGRDVSITCEKTDTTIGCRTFRLIKYTASDGHGNTATCSQTITWSTAASLCGKVFLDCDGSGDVTGGDIGLTTVLVTLKNSAGQTVGTTSTDSNGAYCFSDLKPGTYTVVVTSPAGYIQTAGTTSYHWRDNYGRVCWYDNDNCQHYKGSDGVDCWKGNDGYQHCKDSYGRDCWKDRYGNQHCQPCNYVSCDSRKDNTEVVCLLACDAKSCINFAYYGTVCKATVCVTGPTKAHCGDKITYTCTVSNPGTQCFASGCKVTICGKSYTCPSIQAGGSCSFQVPYQVQWNDFGSLKCQATAYCYPSSGNPYTAQSYCTTSVGW